MSQYLFFLLILACPLMMIFMMRGHGHGHGQGHGGHNDAQAGGGSAKGPLSLEELRRQRDELDEQIAEHEWRGEGSRDRSPEHV